jgi:hypothetical protein
MPPENVDDLPEYLEGLYGDESRRLLADIRHFPFAARLTLLVEEEAMAFDVREDGSMRGKGAEETFLACLAYGIHTQGALMLRQFLPEETCEVTTGGLVWVPRMRLFGVGLKGGGVNPIAIDLLETMHETDHTTGRLLPRENGLEYASWAVLRDTRELMGRLCSNP